jgi:hypothetical protein
LTSPGLLDRIAAALDVALSGRGFPPGGRADAGGALIRRWVRDCAWKRDVVDVVYRRGRTQLSINVSVEVPAAGRHISVDGTNVGYLAGRPDGYPLPRGLFRTWKLRRFVDRIDRDTRAAVIWFDQYDSPRHALKKLQSPERNGCRVDSDPHRAIVAFLESVRDEYPSRRDLIEAFVLQVPSVFGPVAERHGLALRAIEPRLFVLESDTVRVRVRFGSGHEPDVDVLLGPASGRQPGHDDRSPDIFGLSVIGKTLTDQQVFEPQKVATAEEIRRALDTAASVLERECAAILRGDLSIWPQLRRSAARLEPGK